jgi:ribonuclease HI
MPPEKKTSHKNILEIYTDGSCIGNPGIGGFASLILDNGEEKILRGNHPATTNNRMEMTAIISALQWVKKNFSTLKSPSRIKIFSDSNLVIQTLLQNWKRKKNTDLWNELDELIEALERSGAALEWCWVKGHSTNVNNNRADKIALAEALKVKNSRTKRAP